MRCAQKQRKTQCQQRAKGRYAQKTKENLESTARKREIRAKNKGKLRANSA